MTVNISRAVVPNWTTLLYLTAVFLLPTVAFAVINHLFGLQSPVVNADLLLVAIVFGLFGRASKNLALILLLIAIFVIMLIQIAIGIGVVYIDDISLIRDYFQFMRFWPWREISLWAGIGLLAIIPVYFILGRLDFQRIRVLPIAILLLLFVAVDMFADTPLGHRYIGANLLTSSANRSLQMVRKWQKSPGFSASPIASPMMAGMLIEAGDALPARILSVSVEAYGLANAQEFNHAIVAPMEEIAGPLYSVRLASHAAKGGTLTGEMRELCNLKTAGTPTLEDRRRIGPRCLPHQLVEEGYQTLGIHGNSGFFYNRREVYPAIGLAKTLFYDDILRHNPATSRCRTRAFAGICDRESFALALDFLRGDGRRFAHVMTLDTHFPLDAAGADDRKCDLVPKLDNESLCIYAHRMRSILTDLAQQLTSDQRPPDVVYIYGDHPPPYVTKDERAYFNRSAVPFIILTRKAPAVGHE